MSRKLRHADLAMAVCLDNALYHLASARSLLKTADCPKALERLEATLRSAKGARRHMDRRVSRSAIKQHAEVGDFVRKDGELVRIECVDQREMSYGTSDGGCMGFSEVHADGVLLESEAYDDYWGRR